MEQHRLAMLSLGLQAAGMASGAVGSFYSAKMSKQQLAFEAGMADINARLSETAARQDLIKGQAEIGRLTMSVGQLKAKQRTAFAANGIVMGEGSSARPLHRCSPAPGWWLRPGIKSDRLSAPIRSTPKRGGGNNGGNYSIT